MSSYFFPSIWAVDNPDTVNHGASGGKDGRQLVDLIRGGSIRHGKQNLLPFINIHKQQTRRMNCRS